MHFKNGLTFVLALFLLLSTSINAETRVFVGVDSVSSDTNIDYDNGEENYEFSGGRLKIGAEFSEGGVVGLEFLGGDTDEDIDPFGTPFELKTDTSVGMFFHLGRPFYFRLGWSYWDTEYTDLNSNITEKERVSSFEYGVGYQLWIGSNMAIYADYSFSNADAKYPAHFVGEGFVEYDSELLSVGFSTTF